MSYNQIQAGTLFEDFETLGNWTKGANGSIAANTTQFKTGTQSLQLTSASGSNCFADKTINQSFTSTYEVGVWVYIVDLTTVSSLQLILSNDSGFTNYFSRTLSDGNTGFVTGWNFFVIPRDDWVTNGSATWASNMVRLRVRVDAVSNTVAVVSYDGFYKDIYARPKILLTFDDGFDTQYTVAYPYMRSRGLKGTLFIISSYPDVQAGYMTSTQINEMYNAGWDVGNHTATHPFLTADSAAQQNTEVSSCNDYLVSNGWTRNNCHKHLAYPHGDHDSTTITVLQNNSLLTGRTVVSGGTVYQPVNKGVYNPYELKTTSVLNTTTLAVAKTKVDAAIKAGTPQIFVFHTLVDTPSQQTEWPITDFQALMDYIAARLSQLDVVTVSEWYNGLIKSRRQV